jgi:cyclomaltodextrinase
MRIKTPDWVKNAIFYQIFPDRFAQGSQTADGHWQASKLEGWDATPTLQGYKGGNLWGVIEKLDYLQDLGVKAIYFTPIFQSTSNHRYHTHDYYQVDPMLGGNVAFETLIKAAHQRNLKVVLDGVFNHASRGFFFFNDILENGPYSPWLDWFKIKGWPLSAYDGSKPANYEGWLGNRALPEFNHDHPQAREYIMQVGEYWLHQGIDGWRLDVPNEVTTPGFWEEFRSRVKAINPEAYIVGEIWSDASEWLDGKQFDGVMNYLFAVPTIAFVAGDRFVKECAQQHYTPYPAISASEYAEKIEKLLDLYPWEIQLTQLNLLNSHDTSRLLTSVDGDQTSVELATLLLLTFPGAPSIYYGDEVGLLGGKDPDCRRGFPTSENWDLDVLNYHRQLIQIRNQSSALQIGSYQSLYAQEQVYAFARIFDREEIIVAVNTDSNSHQVIVPANNLKSTPSHCLYGVGKINWQIDEAQKQLELIIPPRSGLIIA